MKSISYEHTFGMADMAVCNPVCKHYEACRHKCDHIIHKHLQGIYRSLICEIFQYEFLHKSPSILYILC